MKKRAEGYLVNRYHIRGQATGKCWGVCLRDQVAGVDSEEARFQVRSIFTYPYTQTQAMEFSKELLHIWDTPRMFPALCSKRDANEECLCEMALQQQHTEMFIVPANVGHSVCETVTTGNSINGEH